MKENSLSETSPYKVPEFDVETANNSGAMIVSTNQHIPRDFKKIYTWWSWHPNYATWGRSCWGGETIEEAHASIKKKFASSMDCYHNKLIFDDVTTRKLTVVEDLPCERMDVWRVVKAGRINAGVEK